jgi:serine/threonine protein kinase
MENGAIAQFLEANPMEHRRRYVSTSHDETESPVYDILQMVDILSGVAFLHALGIIHADLKGVRDTIITSQVKR